MNIDLIPLNRPITFVKDGVFEPIIIKGQITEVRKEPYAQYKESIVIFIKEKGKRKSRGYRFCSLYQIAIFEGYVDISTKCCWDESVSGIKSSVTTCFDENNFKNVIRNCGEFPIFNHEVL